MVEDRNTGRNCAGAGEPAAAAGGGPDYAEVGTQSSQSGEERLRIGRRQSDQLIAGHPGELRRSAAGPGPLGAAEEEEFVLLDRAPGRVAKVIAHEYGFRCSVGIVLKGVGRQG